MNTKGNAVVVERSFTQADFDEFAALSGDNNPIHVDAAFSATTRFGRTVSHGVLLMTVLRGLLDRLVPGGKQVSQQLMFPAPTFADEPLRFSAEIRSEDDAGVTAAFRCQRAHDYVVTCEGTTVLRRCGPQS